MKSLRSRRDITRVAALAVGMSVTMLFASCSKVVEERGHILGMLDYVYGFPLVMMDVTKDVITATPTSGQYKAPMNQFGRIRTYVDPDFKDVVRISVNSLWSHAFLDLDQEPMVITVPDTKDRYVVVQALNMWTDDFASWGSRTPEKKSGNFLIAGPKWNGTAPADVKDTARSATRFAWVLVQMSAASPKDFPEIHALQDQLKVTPLGAWGKPYTPPATVPVDPNVDLTATPYDQVRLMTGEMFFNRLAMAMKDNPPYPADSTAVERLKKLGVEAGKRFDASKLEPATLKGISEAPGEVWRKFAQGPYEQKGVNGWLTMLNLGRYGTDYNTRALIAWLGLGALSAEDALYPCAFVDADGNALDGASKYVMHFEKGGLPPSASGVWSISQYRDNFYVRNAIERYGILSSMPLKYNADGSLDVYMQARSPGPDRDANWLPTPPSGVFNLTVRVYQPRKEILDGTYKLPAVRRVQ
jgi:hypothetical protein